jgi:hypothetical protein
MAPPSRAFRSSDGEEAEAIVALRKTRRVVASFIVNLCAMLVI